MAESRKILLPKENLIWTPGVYSMTEIGKKFGQLYPPYVILEQGALRLNNWQSVDPDEVLRIHAIVTQKAVEASFLNDAGFCSEPISIPARYDLQVKILPPRKDDPNHVYKSVKELATDFPPFVKVVSAVPINSPVRYNDVLELKGFVTSKHADNVGARHDALLCNVRKKTVKLPMNFKADFVFHAKHRLYSPYEVIAKFFRDQRVEFVDGIPFDHLAEEVANECRQKSFKNKAILHRLNDHIFYVGTFEAVELEMTNHISYRDEVMFLPSDELGKNTLVRLPMGTVPVPDHKARLTKQDIYKLLSRLLIEHKSQDTILVKAEDILARYPLTDTVKDKVQKSSASKATGTDDNCDTHEAIYESDCTDLSSIYEILVPVTDEAKKRSNPKGLPPLFYRKPNQTTNNAPSKQPVHRPPPPPPPNLTPATEREVYSLLRQTEPAEISRRIIKPLPGTVPCPPLKPSQLIKPMVATPPVTVDGGISTPGPQEANEGSRGPAVIMTISDIPEKLNKLGVDELARCLRLLNLNHAANILRENLIDGEILMSLSSDSLLAAPINLSSFEMEKIKAIKSGWRPKI